MRSVATPVKKNPDPIRPRELCLLCKSDLRPLIDVMLMDGYSPKEIFKKIMGAPPHQFIESHLLSGHVRIDKDGFRQLMIRGMQESRHFMDWQLDRLKKGERIDHPGIFQTFLRTRLWYLQKMAEMEDVLSPPVVERAPLLEAAEEKPRQITNTQINILLERDPTMAIRAAKALLIENGMEIVSTTGASQEAKDEQLIEDVAHGRTGQ